MNMKICESWMVFHYKVIGLMLTGPEDSISPAGGKWGDKEYSMVSYFLNI